MHRPVFIEEVLDELNIKKDGIYIDATLGEGGHFKKISKYADRVLGIDWDDESTQTLKRNITKENINKMKLISGNFAEIETIAKKSDFYPVDGILFDLGLSMRQLKQGKRGFSYEKENESLDMRLNKNIKLTATDLVNNFSETQLYEIFAKNSEELNSRAIAKAIVSTRRLKKIKSVEDLIKIIDKVIGKKDTKVYARIFQALRMTVNNELENLKRGLHGGLRILKSEGKIVILTFHSIEDRVVKQFISSNRSEISKDKYVRPKKRLNFERSAKLRIIIKA